MPKDLESNKLNTSEEKQRSFEIIKGSQISNEGKFAAGTLLILFTIFPIILLIAYWPDKLPKAEQPAVYHHRWFHVSLIDSQTSTKVYDSSQKQYSRKDAVQKKQAVTKDSLKRDSAAKDSANNDSFIARQNRMPLETTEIRSGTQPNPIVADKDEGNQTIHLNTILLILVAGAGFLGSMIYIANSFTNFVGSESFKASWTLWYIVKPFIGAAMAIVIYFVFRAGLLNFNDPSNINLYGIVTLAAFAGLFTDDASLKLKEIFEVIFKPKDTRPNKLEEEQIRITGIKPNKLVLDTKNNLVISGVGLDKRKLILKINDKIITDAIIKGDSISFSYNIPEELKDKKEFKLSITDEKGKELYSETLGI